MKIVLFFISFIGVIFFTSSSLESFQGIISNILSLLFVFGGTMIATLISFPVDKILHIKTVLKKIYYEERFEYTQCTKQTIQLAREYKKKGFKSLEISSKSMQNEYMKLGIRLIADGTEWNQIKSTIQKEYIFESLEYENVLRIIRSMAKYAPAFGLAGTIIGLMRVFPQLSDPTSIGPAISLALLTTLYGVLLANLVFLPLANKVKDNVSDGEIAIRFIIEALQCIHDRDYSIVIEQRLSALLPKHELEKFRSEKTAALRLSIAENS